MRALVTGAAGMLGRDVVKACEAHGIDAIGYTRADLDISDAAVVAAAMAGERPDIVFNCAAYTDVDGAETAEAAATHANGYGAGVLARSASAHDAVIVQVSTDYVFDGASRRPYVESDRPAPLQAYGHSKLAGEIEVAASGERHFIVRSSWLFGPGGPNFVQTILRLGRERGALRVVDDQVGCPTYTGHLADALVTLATTDDFGIHHVAGGGECSWHDFAAEIFDQAGIDVDLERCTTREFPRPAPRPSYSVLGTERERAVYLPDWQEGLSEYLTLGVMAA